MNIPITRSKSAWLWLCAALIVINVAYYLWPFKPATPTPRAASVRAHELLLLSEVEQDSPAPETAAARPQADASLSEEPQPPVDVSLSEEPQRLDAGAAEAVIADSTASESSATKKQQDALLQPLAPTKSVPLALPTTEPIKSVPLALPITAQECWLFGPLRDTGVREALQAQLPASGLSLNIVVRREPVGVEYWVHVPTSGDADEVARLQAEIKSRGIDTYLITQGTLAGSLSLGLFRDQSLALNLVSERAQQGYAVEVAELNRVVKRQWMLLSQAEYEMLGWPTQGGPDGDWPGTAFKPTECPAA